jgi:phage terminase large subunit-like protein
MVTHRIFQPSPDEPLDFEGTVEKTVLEWAKRSQLQAVYFDPWQMVSTSQRLAKHGITVEEFPQSVGNMTLASQTLYELIKGRNLTAYPDDAIRLAVSRAVAVETSRGWRISKEKQSHKVDAVVALAIACHGAMQKQTSYNLFLPGLWE